ncbi:hypothetical protein CEXT_506371 [Caerostris extrusa]|uniref:Uncharacterized protein n=1 Tax=Caerostris extrusa TaxID=172846 RepID=A0AAV4RY97_CAEEX|nr:hypothetical protein CEXT_506371 [Caerostris extrusa]
MGIDILYTLGKYDKFDFDVSQLIFLPSIMKPLGRLFLWQILMPHWRMTPTTPARIRFRATEIIFHAHILMRMYPSDENSLSSSLMMINFHRYRISAKTIPGAIRSSHDLCPEMFRCDDRISFPNILYRK